MSKFSASAPDAFQKTMFVQIAGHGKVWPLFLISRVEVVANSNIMLVRLSGTDFEGNFTEENFRGGQCYINFDLTTAGTIRVPSGYFYVKSITATAGIAPYDLEIWLPEPSQISHSVTITLDNDKEAACFFRMEEFFRACTTRPEWVTGLISREMYIENIVDFTDTVGQKLEYRGGISSVDGLTITHTYGGGAKGSSPSMPQPVGVGTELFFDSFVRWDRLFWRQNLVVLSKNTLGVRSYWIGDIINAYGTVDSQILSRINPTPPASLTNWDTLILGEEVFTILSKTGDPSISTGPSTWTNIEIPGDPPTGGSPVEILYGVTSDSIRKFRGLLKTPIGTFPELSLIYSHYQYQGYDGGNGERYAGYHTGLGKQTEVFVADLSDEPSSSMFSSFYVGYVDGITTGETVNSYTISVSSNLLRTNKKKEETATISNLKTARNSSTGLLSNYNQDFSQTDALEFEDVNITNIDAVDLLDDTPAAKTTNYRWVKFGDDFILPVRKPELTFTPPGNQSNFEYYVYGTQEKYNTIFSPQVYLNLFNFPNLVLYSPYMPTTRAIDSASAYQYEELCRQFLFIGKQDMESDIKSAYYSTRKNTLDEDVEVPRVLTASNQTGWLEDSDYRKYAISVTSLLEGYGRPVPVVVAEIVNPDENLTNCKNLFDELLLYVGYITRGGDLRFTVENAWFPTEDDNFPVTQRVLASPIEFLLQILTSTGTGTIENPGTNKGIYTIGNNTFEYSFDVLPKQRGFAIPLSAINIESFISVAQRYHRLGGTEATVLQTYLCNEYIDFQTDLREYIVEKILQPLFLGLVTDEDGKVKLVDLLGETTSIATIQASDLEVGSVPVVERDTTKLASQISYTGKTSFTDNWQGILTGSLDTLVGFTPTQSSYSYTVNVIGFGSQQGGFGDIYGSIQRNPITINLPSMAVTLTETGPISQDSNAFLRSRAARFIALYNSPIVILSLRVNSSQRLVVGESYNISMDGIPGEDGRASINTKALLVELTSNLKNGTQDCVFYISFDEFPFKDIRWAPYGEIKSVSSSTSFNVGTAVDPVVENWWPLKTVVDEADNIAVWNDKAFAEDDLVVLYDGNFVLKSTDGPVAVDSYNQNTGEIVLKSAWTASSSPITPSVGDIIGLFNYPTQSQHALKWAYMDRAPALAGPDLWIQ